MPIILIEVALPFRIAIVTLAQHDVLDTIVHLEIGVPIMAIQYLLDLGCPRILDADSLFGVLGKICDAILFFLNGLEPGFLFLLGIQVLYN